ncbi:MAG: HEPN domain-containing protein [Candidatus Bathyarchaeia archaeon]
MRFDRLAEDYLRRARSRLIDAKSAFDRGDHPDAVLYCQECVEFSIKACLRLVGVEYPREHDVGGVLIDSADLLPEWLRGHVDKMAEISGELALLRGPSVYGEERRGIPPSELFTEADGKRALERAEVVFEKCKRFLEWFKTKGSSPS